MNVKEQGNNLSKSLFNVSLLFCTCENYFARDENQKDDFRFQHSIHEPRKYLRLIIAKFVMLLLYHVQVKYQSSVARSHNVLNFELAKLNGVAQFLQYSGELSHSNLAKTFVLRPRTHNLAR